MLSFVTGKGGVGKTHISLLLHEQTNAKIFATEPIPNTRTKSPVFVLDPKTCVREYLTLKLKLKKAVKVLIDNKFVSSLLEVTPGVEAIVTSGKVYEASKEGSAIIDSPSSGHFIPWISTCKSLEKVIPFGPVHEDAKRMRETFYDPTQSQVNVVALPQDLVLEETEELIEELKKEGLPLGKIYMNKVIGDLPTGPKGSLEELFMAKKEVQAKLLKNFSHAYESVEWVL